MKPIFSLTGNGVRDHVLQRASAVYMALYAVFIAIMVYGVGVADSYALWLAFFSNPWTKIASFFGVLAVVTHGWIGVWTVITDYIRCSCLRGYAQWGLVTVCIAECVWGIAIIWG